MSFGRFLPSENPATPVALFGADTLFGKHEAVRRTKTLRVFFRIYVLGLLGQNVCDVGVIKDLQQFSRKT